MGLRKELLVEGSTDLHVITNLRDARGIPDTVSVVNCKGIEKLLRLLPVKLMESNLGTLGVVVDADLSSVDRWSSIAHILRKLGYTDIPTNPDASGTIITTPPQDKIVAGRVGIWLMPDNKSPGMLEDFLNALVPAGSTLFRHVVASVEAIPPRDILFPESAKPKALLHTWLAWQREPGKPPGQAIAAKYLNPASTGADAFLAWYNRLYHHSAQ